MNLCSFPRTRNCSESLPTIIKTPVLHASTLIPVDINAIATTIDAVEASAIVARDFGTPTPIAVKHNTNNVIDRDACTPTSVLDPSLFVPTTSHDSIPPTNASVNDVEKPPVKSLPLSSSSPRHRLCTGKPIDPVPTMLCFEEPTVSHIVNHKPSKVSIDTILLQPSEATVYCHSMHVLSSSARYQHPTSHFCRFEATVDNVPTPSTPTASNVPTSYTLGQLCPSSTVRHVEFVANTLPTKMYSDPPTNIFINHQRFSNECRHGAVLPVSEVSLTVTPGATPAVGRAFGSSPATRSHCHCLPIDTCSQYPPLPVPGPCQIGVHSRRRFYCV